MSKSFCLAILLGLIATTLLVTAALADSASCMECGCHCSCQKVCRLKKEEKKLEVVCYGVKCEDFCLPGPACRGCQHKEEACVDCEANNCGDLCNRLVPDCPRKKFVWSDWIPGSAKIHTKHKLQKKIVAKKVSSYKWVVEDLCESCKQASAKIQVEPGIELPQPPALSSDVEFARPIAVSPPPLQ